MKLTIPLEQVTTLRAALDKAGAKEIGGQIYGEQIAPSVFIGSDFTFQKRLGTISRFLVDLVQAATDALAFFDRTQHRYTRFNYIGEWHSHPSFALRPSCTDVQTMRELVASQNFDGQFAVLLICKLTGNTVELGGWLFDPEGREFPILLEVENE